MHVLEVVSHPTGPWLIKAGDIIYAVPPRLGRALQPLAGKLPGRREVCDCLAEVRQEPSAQTDPPDLGSWVDELMVALDPSSGAAREKNPDRGAGRAVRFRIPLLSVPLVRKLAAGLRVLSGNRGLIGLALLGGWGYLTAGFGPQVTSWDPVTLGVGLVLFFLTALWHELGHATALARSGYPPGGIGAGVLFVIPVLFADVTAVNALRRSERIRVDISGVVFQGAAGGLLMALGHGRSYPALTLAGSSALLAISWSLFPFIRSDGYWLLCDWLDLKSLDRPPRRPVGSLLRKFLVGFQLANAAFLLVIGIYLPLKMAGLLGFLLGYLGIPPGSPPGRWLTAAMGVGLAAMLGVGVVRKILALIRSARVVARCP